MQVSSEFAHYQQLSQHHRIALLTAGHSTPFLAKTAISLLRYRPDDIAAILDADHAGQNAEQLFGCGNQVPVIADLSDWQRLPDRTNIDAIYIGIAPPGGKLPHAWRPLILDAIGQGIDIVSGLHDFLSCDETFQAAAHVSGAKLIDVRKNTYKETATHRQFPKSCIRIHAVGHDCSVGKMVATVELEKALLAAGEDAKFLATGQTGIMISGQGVPIDCVVSDFVNGAAEQLVAANEHHPFLLVEGQGSLAHPAFSAVTLGLLHGCAPQGLIYCYEAGRTHVKGIDHVPIVSQDAQMQAYLIMANLRFPCKFIGIAVNSRRLGDNEARQEIERMEARYQLPTCDVYRDGAHKLVQAALRLRDEWVTDKNNC